METGEVGEPASTGHMHACMFHTSRTHAYLHIYMYQHICLAAGHIVHEARSAGHFIPGRGHFPVEKMPEKELQLLQPPNSLDTNEVAKGGPPAVVETPAMPTRKERPANTPAVVETAGTGPNDDDGDSLPTIPGFVDDSQIPPTQIENTQQQQSSVIPVEETQGERIRREKTVVYPRGRDPSPSYSVGSLASRPSSSSRKSSKTTADKADKYAKYKDGSYWKCLG